MDMGNCNGSNKIHPGEKSGKTINVLIPDNIESQPRLVKALSMPTHKKYIPHPLPRIGHPEE